MKTAMKPKVAKQVFPAAWYVQCPHCQSNEVVGPSGSLLISYDEADSELTCNSCGGAVLLPRRFRK